MKRSPSLSLREGAGQALLRPANATPRLRPGDYPVWCELDLSPTQQARLRRLAHDHRIGTDALVGIVLEFTQVAEVVGDEQIESLASLAEVELHVPTIGVSPELRAWQRLLEGRTEPRRDELPSISIPLRLLAQLPVQARQEVLHAAVAAVALHATAALALESAATRRGMTMSFWAFRESSGL